MDEACDGVPANLQLLVSLPWGSGSGRTRVLPVPFHDEGVTAGALLAPVLREAEAVAGRALPPLMATYHGKRYQMHEPLPLPSDATACASGFDVVHVSLARGGLLGGKGGFGAMLRSMGKGAGVKKTTDFGACRDLYGRRLRHVNDEIRLKKWLEDKEQESESRDRKRGQNAPEKTPSGIDGWYLSVPSWADLKPSNANAQRKANRKTSLCKHWIQAREGGRRPPPGAPLHWGCPSGTRCNFAHGDEELRGEGLEQLRAMEKEMAERQRDFEKERYMGAQALAPPVDVQSAVLEGLKVEARARKKGKTGPLELYGGAPGEEEAEAGAQKKKGCGPGFLPIGFGTGEVSWSTQSQCPWMETLSGSLNIGAQGTLSGGIVGEFATVIIPLRRSAQPGQEGHRAAAAAAGGVMRGAWYYEVEAVSAEGSVQIGWVTDNFDADANEGDGVGDDRNSWGLDPSQRKAWHNEEERDFGPSEKWEVGDVLGVLLELDGGDGSGSGGSKKTKKGAAGGGGRISYFLNGQPLGVAFEGLPRSSSPAGQAEGGEADARPTLVLYYPALSLDEGEALRVNIGMRPFAFPQCLPQGAKAVAEALTEPVDVLPLAPAAAPSPASASPLSKGAEKQQPQVKALPAAAKAAAKADGEGKSGGNASKAPPPPKRDMAPEALDLSAFASAEELEALGLDRLKAALMALEVKCGGTLQERAARLWSLRGITDPSEIDTKLRAKNAKK